MADDYENACDCRDVSRIKDFSTIYFYLKYELALDLRLRAQGQWQFRKRPHSSPSRSSDMYTPHNPQEDSPP